MISNWTINSVDLARKEKELWLPAWTIQWQIDNSILKDIRSRFDNILWESYQIKNLPSLLADVKSEMEAWRSYFEAIENVMSRELEENEDYIRMKHIVPLEERKHQLNIEKFRLDREYKLWNLSNARYNAQTSRINSQRSQAWVSPGDQNIIDLYQATFNKSVPKDMTSTAMVDAIVKKQEDIANKSLKDWTINSQDFFTRYQTELNEIIQWNQNSKKEEVKKWAARLIGDLKKLKVNDDQIKWYLIDNDLLKVGKWRPSVGKNQPHYLYLTDDGNKIKSTIWLWDPTIYNFDED